MRVLPGVSLAILFLAACHSSGNVPLSKPISSVAGHEADASTAGVAALAHPDQNPAETTDLPASNEVPPGVVIRQFTPLNSGKRFEEVEIRVDISRPGAQGHLAPYLMNLDEWMVVKCVHLSPSEKLYRFRRVVPTGGRSPTVDPFNAKKP